MPLNTTLPSVSQAQSLLTPTQSDQSVGILNKLFGIPNGNWHSIYYQTIGGVGNGSLFFTLLKDFDLVVLAFVVITVFITMAIGVTSTAHEGKAFGNRYHALWTPLRSAFAMVLLAPIPGVGLSLIQGAVLLMIWFSIGGANYLATQATTYMAQNGGQLTSIAPGGGQLLAKETLQSELAMAFFVNYEGKTINPIYTVSPWRPDPLTASDASLGPTAVQDDPGHYTITFATPAKSGGFLGFYADGLSTGQAGKFTVQCARKSDPMCSAEVSALVQMIKTIAPYAVQAVNSTQAAAGSSSISAANKAAATTPTTQAALVVYDAGEAYDKAVANAEQAVISQAHPELVQAMDNINSSVSHLGWWTLGMYYWNIARVNAGIQTQVGRPPVWSGFDMHAIYKAMSSKTDRKTFAKIAAAAGASVREAKSTDGVSVAQSLLTKVFTSQGAWFTDLSPWRLLNGDPLERFQTAGDLIVTTEVPAAIATYTTLRSVASGANEESEGAGWFGEGTSWLTGAANAAVKTAGPYVTMAAIALFVIGAIWAYYLPSVPFILWTMALIGWLIFLIEALVGSVVWAAGIALPEGEGIFGPRGDQGVMLFINIMFRPALMVIGFFASFMLLNVLGPLVGGSFGVFMGGMYSATGSGVTASSMQGTIMSLNPFTYCAAAAITTILMLILVHKLFGLITWIPENVMRWVGGQGVQLGEGGDEQRARSHVDAVGAFVNKGGAGQKAAKGAGGASGIEKGAGAGAGGGEVGVNKVGGGNGGTDVAGGGDVVEAPPTKPE